MAYPNEITNQRLTIELRQFDSSVLDEQRVGFDHISHVNAWAAGVGEIGLLHFNNSDFRLISGEVGLGAIINGEGFPEFPLTRRMSASLVGVFGFGLTWDKEAVSLAGPAMYVAARGCLDYKVWDPEDGYGVYLGLCHTYNPTPQVGGPGISLALEWGSPTPLSHQYVQATALDAVSGLGGAILLQSKIEDPGMKGLARDRAHLSVNFSLIDNSGKEIYIGQATTNHDGIATFYLYPDNPHYPSGNIKYRTAVSVAKGNGDIANLFVIKDKPVVLVDLKDILEFHENSAMRMIDHVVKNYYRVKTDAQDKLQQIAAAGYQIVYVSEHDSSNKDDIQRAIRKLPAGPILLRDLGVDSPNELAATLSKDKIQEYWDSIVANLRATHHVPIVAAMIGSNDKAQLALWHAGIAIVSPEDLLKKKSEFDQVANNFFEALKNGDPLETQLDLLTNTRVVAGNCIGPLISNGSDSLTKIKELIERSNWINVQMYQFGGDSDDQVSKQLINLLTHKVKQGKPVNIMIDAVGSRWLILRNVPERFEAFVAAGGKLSRYGNPFAESRNPIDALINRDHSKVIMGEITTPDGETYVWAVLGGRNLRDEFFYEKDDFSLVVQGPITLKIHEHLRAMFSIAKYPNKDWSNFSEAANERFKKNMNKVCEDNESARFVSHFPNRDRNIERSFIALLQDPNATRFVFESTFPLTTELMAAFVEEQNHHPLKEIIWITGTGNTALDALRDIQADYLMRKGIHVVVRDPKTNTDTPNNKLSRSHAKIASNGTFIMVGTHNPDDQSDDDVEDVIIWKATSEELESIMNKLVGATNYRDWIDSLPREGGIAGNLRARFFNKLEKLNPDSPAYRRILKIMATLDDLL